MANLVCASNETIDLDDLRGCSVWLSRIAITYLVRSIRKKHHYSTSLHLLHKRDSIDELEHKCTFKTTKSRDGVVDNAVDRWRQCARARTHKLQTETVRTS